MTLIEVLVLTERHLAGVDPAILALNRWGYLRLNNQVDLISLNNQITIQFRKFYTWKKKMQTSQSSSSK